MAASIPVSSLVAVLIICIGIGLFCGTGYVGCSLVFDAFNVTSAGYLYVPPAGEAGEQTTPMPGKTTAERVEDVVKPVQISILCLSSFMVIEVIYFLFQAFMATAAINRTEYTKQTMPCGNKGWTAVSVVFSYLLTLLWALVLPAAFYCFLITYMLYKNPNQDINLATYGLKEGVIQFGNAEAITFQNQMGEVFVMFAICTGASLIVLIGMINLSMCHSANLAHLKTASFWQRYNERRHEDQMELSSYTNHGAVQNTNDVPLNMYAAS